MKSTQELAAANSPLSAQEQAKQSTNIKRVVTSLRTFAKLEILDAQETELLHRCSGLLEDMGARLAKAAAQKNAERAQREARSKSILAKLEASALGQLPPTGRVALIAHHAPEQLPDSDITAPLVQQVLTDGYRQALARMADGLAASTEKAETELVDEANKKFDDQAPHLTRLAQAHIERLQSYFT
jgi:hypothetical protein